MLTQYYVVSSGTTITLLVLRGARGRYARDNTVYRYYRGHCGNTARLTRDRFAPEPGAATLSIRRFPRWAAMPQPPSCGAAAEVPNGSTVLLVVGGEHCCGRVLNRMPERTKTETTVQQQLSVVVLRWVAGVVAYPILLCGGYLSRKNVSTITF